MGYPSCSKPWDFWCSNFPDILESGCPLRRHYGVSADNICKKLTELLETGHADEVLSLEQIQLLISLNRIQFPC